MKKVKIGATTLILLVGALCVLMHSAHADERAHWLSGEVMYGSDSTGVGSGKPVEIYFMEHPPSAPPVVYTDSNSKYKYSFYPPQYFYKVRCRFQSGLLWYSGETIIDDTLYGDDDYDIYVYPEN